MAQDQTPYIPAGCLHIPKDKTRLDDDLWGAEDVRTWKTLTLSDDSEGGQHRQEQHLRPDLQAALFKTPGLGNITKLFLERWIQLEFCVTDDEHAILRVHLLPDDVLRGAVDRSEPTLQKARCSLLSTLDYSKVSWEGHSTTSRTQTPIPYSPSQDHSREDVSLLELFNRIPSPQPNAEGLLDDYAKDAMIDLLESKIPGLSTELYPYQRRSAALMLQKEVQPGSILDSRLVHVRDQHGSGWYVDMVAGTVLLEPQIYDDISGGILAEEMGAGKTIICLALILATKNLPTAPPSVYHGGKVPSRKKIGSLADMSASCATRNALPWKTYFHLYSTQLGIDFNKCTEALGRNPGFYLVPAPKPRRVGRHPSSHQPKPPSKIYLSDASLVVVPNNLVVQWKQEIQKHTEDLSVHVVVKNDPFPTLESLLKCDILLVSQTRIERVGGFDDSDAASVLSQVHFKRCIVDEGHKLGNSKISVKSNLLIALDKMSFSSRWIVTGTPSQGLFGVDNKSTAVTPGQNGNDGKTHETTAQMEKRDLERIGSITSMYLKARPWANTIMETGDTVADWSVYLMLPKHRAKGKGRWECLESTLNSLIIRHQLAEVRDLLPPVEEKITVLSGSYQDQLSLNIFSMMIIFNAVQSQRTDMDYFFHPKQKKSLLQIVHNLKQTSFFGGSFFTAEEIAKSVETAEKFLEEKKVAIGPEDEALLQAAIECGHMAIGNKLRNLSNQFHEMPLCVKNFPGGAGQSWSLGGAGDGGNDVCTSASLLLALQKLVFKTAGQPEELNSLLNGRLIQEGVAERDKILLSLPSANPPSSTQTLAGNTKLGKDSPRKSRPRKSTGGSPKKELVADAFFGPLKSTRIASTVSAKLSYLIDGIVKYQDEEKIIVFYENDNVAWYLASMLEVLQIKHLIYAKGLTVERRAEYVNSFHHNPTFRVLLMDLSQAAFGLDMKAASRIYFINPVLNPQVEAQAIGRVRRISQQKPVSVETLVLRGSIDEVLLERKKHMTQAEHRHIKSILDIRPLYNWIKNAKILPVPECSDDESQMVALQTPQDVFGRGFGKTVHPDDGLILGELPKIAGRVEEAGLPGLASGLKRAHLAGPGSEPDATAQNASLAQTEVAERPARRVRFAADSDSE